MLLQISNKMRVKSELLLYRLSWTMGIMLSPTWRNMNDSFESWAYRNGCLRQIQTLEGQDLVEGRDEAGFGKARVYRLTELGRLAALGGRDPEVEWSRKWDGHWGMVLFDIPEAERPTRGLLRAALRSLHFGCLQKSVWISPHAVTHITKSLKRLEVDASSLVLMEARTSAGEAPLDMVETAWDFKGIKRAWEKLEEHLEAAPGKSRASSQETLAEWSAGEFALWQTCMTLDPLLPKALHADGYEGIRVWKQRKHVLASLGRQLLAAGRTAKKPA
jgi:DNA-binding transcriptional regulator PaaX